MALIFFAEYLFILCHEVIGLKSFFFLISSLSSMDAFLPAALVEKIGSVCNFEKWGSASDFEKIGVSLCTFSILS